MDPLILVNRCYDRLPNNLKNKPWVVTEHGRKVLQTEDELNAYIAAYGEMHIVKCRAALQNFPFKELENLSYEIFDWGCGQGLATLTLLDMLYERDLLSKLRKIYLIEPSLIALNRATKWVQQNLNSIVKVIPVNKSIPCNIYADLDEIKCSSNISINLFSNILDIRNLSLEWLARKTASFSKRNYMVCVGPKFTNGINTRISDFCGYFQPKEYFTNISLFPYSYTTKTHHAYGCEAKTFLHEQQDLINLSYKEIASNESYIDPYDYTSDALSNIVDKHTADFYNKLRSLEKFSYDIFFRPNINCDTIDFVLSSSSKGIILINVCKNLDELETEFRKIETIKSNLFNIHLKKIRIDSIIQSSVFNCIKIGLFFPNNNLKEINNKINLLCKSNNITDSNPYNYLYKFTSESDLKDELEHIYARYFRYEYYDELINIIASKWHSYKDGDLNFNLTKRQEEIVRSTSKRNKVKGVAGCGKTQVVANMAVEQQLKTGDRVLILTFNISLIQYIRMRINQVPADFSPNMFEVINYHQFFLSKANQYNRHHKVNLSDFDDANFFDKFRSNIHKYKSIIIDEIQDFKEAWLLSIVKNFLEPDGFISVFGDGTQNIYDREVEKDTKMPSLRGCGFPGGSWATMSEQVSLRSQNPQIALLATSFAKNFLNSDTQLSSQQEFPFEEYYIKYWNIGNKNIDTIVSNIRWIITKYNLSPKDVVILGQSINLLRDIENVYTSATNENSMINFETAIEYAKIKESYTTPEYLRKKLTEVRRAAKTHFTTFCDEIKLSTIHSFKGWESKTIILLLQPEMNIDENYDGYQIHTQENSSALIYTAITRAKCNLFILNLNNMSYHSFFKENIK